MAVSRRLRFEILKRDDHTCRYCGQSAPDVKLQVDHVIPVALGGGDGPDNLVAACTDCNAGKTSSTPAESVVAAVSLDSRRWTQAISEAAAARSASRAEFQKARDLFERRWAGRRVPSDWGSSVDNFVRLGLSPTDVEFYAERAGEKGRSDDHAWKWFCKVCWSEVKSITAAAAERVGRPSTELDAPAAVVVIPTRPETEQCIECDERPALDSGWSLPGAEGLCGQCRRLHFEDMA